MFFSVCGVGFDAMVTERFARSEKRGLIGYVELGMEIWREFQPEKYIQPLQGSCIIACRSFMGSILAT